MSAKYHLTVRALLALARPMHWSKNGFVLLPLFFGHKLFDFESLYTTLLAAFAFCLLSSAVYAMNDSVDVAADRTHSEKRTRPLAAGALSIATALIFAGVMALLAFAIAALQCLPLLGVLVAYFVLQASYSFVLKRVALLDIAAIAFGFVLRIVAGGVAANVELSPWIVVMTFLLALMLALGKRHSDLFHAAPTTQMALWPGYTLRFAEQAIVMLATCTAIAYLFYTLSPDVLARHGWHPLYFSAIWVLFGVLRYLQRVINEGAGGSPTRLALTDRGILAAVIGWFTTLIFILY